MDEKQVENGGIIFREGDTADVAYIVISGRVELIERSQGRAVQSGLVEAGHAFGELALFDSQAPRTYTARAFEASVLAIVSPNDFAALLPECPKAIQPFLLIAFEKMKAVKIRKKTSVNAVMETDISKILLIPDSDKMRAQFVPMEIAIARLPFRIGGYPEGEEIRRRDQLHLYIAAQHSPLMVSRQHCEIAIEDKKIIVTDLGSRFCTTVNNVILGRGHGSYMIPLQKGENHIILGVGESPYRFIAQCE